MNSKVNAVYNRVGTNVRVATDAGGYSVHRVAFNGKPSGIIGQRSTTTISVKEIGIRKTKVGSGQITGNFKIHVYDEISSTIVELEQWAEFILPDQMAKVFKRSLTQKVKKFYNSKNNGKWSANTKMWRSWKLQRGLDSRPMHMHDKGASGGIIRPLSETVKQFGKLITVVKSSKNTYSVHGLEAEFFSNPYVWLHETGYTTGGCIPGKKVPARPFIVPAMQEAAATSIRIAYARNPLTKPRSSISYTVGPGIYSAKVEGSSAGIWRWLWFFIPQVEEYKYLGAVYDIQGYMTGDFMSTATMKHFASALLMGKAGQVSGMPLSSKMARRSSRKALWGTSSVSLLGAA